ncbi:MAG: hypothetical protein PHU69_13000 [Fermentimonas sp.]|nr:hypothetical protein [Fermentimonas sp.]
MTRFSNLNWLDLPNCINLSKNGHYSILKISCCQGDTCSFKLTQEEKDAAACKVKEKLSSLDEETQEKIARKYYNDRRPWQE